jgi:hypothetical protein
MGQVLQFPSPRTVALDRLDGTPFASAGFLPGLASAPWSWVQMTVATELSVAECDVDCAEGPDGQDWITVHGLPVYVCRVGSVRSGTAQKNLPEPAIIC